MKNTILSLSLLLLLAAPSLAAYTAYPDLTASSANGGLTTGGVIGYTVYALDGATVIQARTTTGIVESPVGSGYYTVTGGLSVPANTTYIVRWDRSDTGAFLAAAKTQYNSLGTDNNAAINSTLTQATGANTGAASNGTAIGGVQTTANTIITNQAANVSTLSGNQTAILNRLGTPAGASLSADVATNQKTGVAVTLPANVLGPQDLLAMEQGIMQYQLGGTKFGTHILNMDANLNGTSTPTYNGLAQTSPFTWNGVTYITSVVTRNSQGQVLSKTVTPTNQ